MMLRVFTHKLTSKRGASLSMALMLLLVCTTVAGVALTAATVVSGRQARTKAVDKSYYNVTSAAKLFWDEMKNNSVVVHTTRSCATTNAGAAPSIDPNSWTCSIDGIDMTTTRMSTSNASLFQLATCDLLFNTGTGVGGTHTFEGFRALDADKIAATVDTSGTEPVLKEVNSPDATYAPFTVTPSDDIKERFKTVYVTMRRKYGDTFEFVFSEKAPDGAVPKANYECTITAGVSLGDGTFTHEEGNTRLSSTLDVSWTPLTMSSGGVGQ